MSAFGSKADIRIRGANAVFATPSPTSLARAAQHPGGVSPSIYEPGGREFESLRARHLRQTVFAGCLIQAISE